MANILSAQALHDWNVAQEIEGQEIGEIVQEATGGKGSDDTIPYHTISLVCQFRMTIQAYFDAKDPVRNIRIIAEDYLGIKIQVATLENEPLKIH